MVVSDAWGRLSEVSLAMVGQCCGWVLLWVANSGDGWPEMAGEGYGGGERLEVAGQCKGGQTRSKEDQG